MTNDTQQIVNKAWNFAHVLRDDGLSYMAYTEQITFLLFLKMADEQTKPPYKRADLDEFVECYRPGKRHLRKPTWTEANPEGRWRSFDYDDLMKRDKVNLDIFWLRDKSLEDSDDLPTPDVLAQEIADDLQTALEQFTAIAEKVKA
jgi:type I restriction-modification system DNA methylase subunit